MGAATKQKSDVILKRMEKLWRTYLISRYHHIWNQENYNGGCTIDNKTNHNFILSLNSPTKASLLGAVIFTLQQARWLPISKNNVVFLFTIFMIVTKVNYFFQLQNIKLCFRIVIF